MTSQTQSKTYVVEHLDPELGDWSALEYLTIAREAHNADASFLLSGVPESLAQTLHTLPLIKQPGFSVKKESVEELYKAGSGKELVCLLDPAATQELSALDADTFDIFLFGGILGDDPPRDRTSELRQKGFQGRRLGSVQMTTDTAVRVTRMVVQEGRSLDDIEWVDYPEFHFGKGESTTMPFRYVKGLNGMPILPEGMMDLLKDDASKGIADLL